MRARQDCTDYEGKHRKAGEEWLVTTLGAYLPAVDEEVLDQRVEGYILTEEKALHIAAITTFTDRFIVTTTTTTTSLLSGVEVDKVAPCGADLNPCPPPLSLPFHMC